MADQKPRVSHIAFNICPCLINRKCDIRVVAEKAFVRYHGICQPEKGILILCGVGAFLNLSKNHPFLMPGQKPRHLVVDGQHPDSVLCPDFHNVTSV